MSVGLLALLDDVAMIARAAAASLDDVAVYAGKAGAKTAGVVVDDAAVTPRYVTGLSPARELPIVWRIARGSLFNKLVLLMPAALALGLIAPGLITPLLMLGGFYLSFEGAEKVHEWIAPHAAHAAAERRSAPAQSPEAFENARVASAVRTDFILSAEIMAIALGAVADAGFFTQAAALAFVGLFITGLVYGAVALIVKLDDAGVALARREGASALIRGFGRGLVKVTPGFLKALSIVGTIAMLWVGGGILAHGLHVFGVDTPRHAIDWLEGLAGFAGAAVGSGLFGLAIGYALIPVAERVIAPLWGRAARLFG